MIGARLGVLATAALLLLAVPVSASASCGSEIVDAAAQGTLSAWYSPGCYTQATKLLTPDLRAYSDAPQLITDAARRARLQKLHVVVAKRVSAGTVRVTFTPPVGTIRVSVFARKGGRFVVAAIATLRGAGGTLKARLGKATRIRVSAGYPGSGDKPVTITLTVKRG